MKTASRILGSAAFHAGYWVQDCPIYGGERRGAPIAAFTRFDREPILERGVIVQPDPVVVADDTLLGEPAAEPTAGCGPGTTLLVNSTLAQGSLRALVDLDMKVVSDDFTELVLRKTGRVASLSTALGVAAAALVGLSEEDALAGVEQELGEAHLTEDLLARNLELARSVYSRAGSWPRLMEKTAGVSPGARALQQPTKLVEVTLEPPRRSAPSIYATGNTPQRKTGSWRQFRPVLEKDKCSCCWLCFVSCPEAAISLDADEYPVVDYDVCKGCLLCAHECPTDAFRIEQERRQETVRSVG
jgi:pyruvate ferredoxin oxidoreductase gamma subunit